MKNLIYISLVVCLFHCKMESSVDNKPTNFIEKDEFENLVYDVNILEGSLQNFNLNQDILKDSSMSLYKGVFEKYGINFKDFKNIQDYYILTDQYLEISENVLARIKQEEEQYADIVSIKIMSFAQFNRLLETDGLLSYFQNDTNSTYRERLDSALNFYRKDPSLLKTVNIDSVSFELSINKLKKGGDVFRAKSVFKKMMK